MHFIIYTVGCLQQINEYSGTFVAHMHSLFTFIKLGIVGVLCFTLTHAFAVLEEPQWEKKQYSTMGTNILIEVHHSNSIVRKQAIAAVMAEMERVNQSMSTYIETSDISNINAHAFEQAVVVSQEIFDLLELSMHISSLSDGAFDITYASVGYLYSYPEKTKPSDAQITELLSAINYQLIALNKEDTSVRFLHKDLKIDLRPFTGA